jgi:CHAD domain-containing protein
MTVLADAHLRTWVDEQVRELVAQGEIALADTDPEGVHQLRVAVRRLHAGLRTDELRAELKWFFGELGPVRDLDVLLMRFRDDTDGFSADEMAAFERLLSGLVVERTAAQQRAAAALRSERYERLLAALREVDPGGPGAAVEVDAVAEIARPHRKLRKAVTKIGRDPADQDLHDLRIRGKKLRYAAELAAKAGGRPVRKLVKATKRLQDVLGEHQDACVAEERVRALVTENTQEAFVAGRLVERERNRQAAARAEWYEAYLEVDQAAAAVLG